MKAHVVGYVVPCREGSRRGREREVGGRGKREGRGREGSAWYEVSRPRVLEGWRSTQGTICRGSSAIELCLLVFSLSSSWLMPLISFRLFRCPLAYWDPEKGCHLSDGSSFPTQRQTTSIPHLHVIILPLFSSISPPEAKWSPHSESHNKYNISVAVVGYHIS